MYVPCHAHPLSKAHKSAEKAQLFGEEKNKVLMAVRTRRRVRTMYEVWVGQNHTFILNDYVTI
jgi:hypothetical protein